MVQGIEKKPGMEKRFPVGLIIVAVVMMLFGSAEVVTGYTHQFFGLTTAELGPSTLLGMALGLLYFAAGVLILTKRRWAGILAIVLLGGDVLGRIAMVAFGWYPLDSFRQTFGIVAGTAIAAFFAVYASMKLKFFR